MIDIHCHVLPQIDDGPANLLTSIEMAKKACSEGITHIFATPHHMNARYENSKSNILTCVMEFQKHLRRENIPLVIHPGQEVRIHRELFTSLEIGELLTLDDKGKYLLLELPAGEVPEYTRDTVYELLLKGITPIIVHPERNKGFLEEQHLLFEIVEEGALTQLTAGSILGSFGKRIKSFSEKIIQHQLAHFIASDAHNTSVRGFCLGKAYERITHKYGIQQTFLFKENTELLLRGQNIRTEGPIPIRKRILGIF